MLPDDSPKKLDRSWIDSNENKKGVKLESLNPSYLLVPGPGIEPGTHGFSVRCSTD